MSAGHSVLAPSSAHRWIPCPGSIALVGPNTFGGSRAAAEGTVAHWVGEQALRSGKPCSDWIGTERTELSDDGTERWDFVVDAEMAAYTQVYVDYCRRLMDERPGASLIEARVDLSEVLGVPETGGTADFVQIDALITAIVEVVDLKYGFTRVEAEGNEQEMLYASGVVAGIEADELPLPDEIVITIAQPRLDHLPSHTITLVELREFEEVARDAAQKVQEALTFVGPTADMPHLNPGETQCEWCPAKATCPALADFVTQAVFDDDDPSVPGPVPDDSEALDVKRSKVKLIQSWCKAIVSEVDARTARGEMPGWKMVKGKRGNRAWGDPEVAEKLLKSFRLKQDEMYDRSLISPTKAEKVVKPKQWEKAKELITQADGKDTAVPASDPREEIPTAGLFDDPAEGLI